MMSSTIVKEINEEIDQAKLKARVAIRSIDENSKILERFLCFSAVSQVEC